MKLTDAEKRQVAQKTANATMQARVAIRKALALAELCGADFIFVEKLRMALLNMPGDEWEAPATKR